MQMTTDELKRRAAAIRLPLAALATEAGYAASTPYRWAGDNANMRSVKAMQVKLEGHELDLLAYLQSLHGSVSDGVVGDA